MGEPKVSLAGVIARDGRVRDQLGAESGVLRRARLLSTWWGARCGGRGSVKFSDTKGHERVSAGPKERERGQKSQVLPWWEQSQGLLTQKRSNKKTSYWLTLRKSWAHWGEGRHLNE